MKKRYLPLLLLCGAFVIGASAACNDTPGEGPDTGNTEHTQHVDGNNDGICDECKEPMPGEGPGTGNTEHTQHVDGNNDGICDECNEPMPGDGGHIEEPPVDEVTETAVTYVFVKDDVRLTYEVTQTVGTALTYTNTLVSYTDAWYSDEACTTPVEKAAGEEMTVYTSFREINVQCVFRTVDRSQSKTVQGTKREGVTLIEGFDVTGYDFLGWTNGGNTYEAGEHFSLEDANANTPVIFEASLSIQSYSVTYKSEGVEDETVTQEYGSAVKGAITRKGYTFLCWADEEGNAVETIESAITLTAQWEILTYSVTVYSYTDEGVETHTTQDYDWNTTVTPTTSEREGFDFSHWTVSVDGGEAEKLENDTYLVGNDAHYEASEIVIRPVYIGYMRTVTVVNGAEASVEVYIGDNLYESLQSAEGDGFSGWFFDEELSKPVGIDDKLPYIAPGETYTIYAAVNKTYTVTFVVDGEETTKEFAFKASFTDADVGVKKGHTFLGWFTEAEGGDEVTGIFASPVTVYGHFSINSYTVTYEAGDEGNNPPAPVTKEYGAEITVAEAGSMTCPNATFSHWVDDDENEYHPGDTFTLEEDIVLHAVWNKKEIRIVLQDWDGYTIYEETLHAGDTFAYNESALKFWLSIDEFAGFKYSDWLGNEYELKEGDVLSAEFEEIEATAYYVNRYTMDELYTAKSAEILKNLVYYQRKDSGNVGTWIVSGKAGVSGVTGNKLTKQFIVDGLPKNFALPVTWQGQLVTGIPDSDVSTDGAFSIGNANNSNAGGFVYDPTPYSVDTLYIPSHYNFIGAFAFATQGHKTVYIGRNSAITEFTESNGITASASLVIGLPDNLQVIQRSGFMGRSTEGDPESFVVYDDEMNRITELPASIKKLYIYSLNGNNIFEKVDLSNITYLGSQVFMQHTNIKEVVIGSTLTNIPDSLFRNCTGLTSIHIPSQVTMIAGAAFASCSNLTEITFAPDSKLIEVGEWAFLFNKATELELPEGLQIVGSAAFAGNYSFQDDNNAGTGWYDEYSPLAKLTLPSTLKYIDSFAFASTSISEVNFPASLEQIGKGAFYDTPDLKHITLNEGLKYIREGAFRKQRTYEWNKADEFELTIPSTVELIGGGYHQGAFESFKNIVGIKFAVDASTNKSALRNIAAYAFADLTELRGELEFPEGLAAIDAYVFPVQAPATGFYDDDLEGPKVTSIIIPGSVYTVGYEAFKNFYQLTKIEFKENEGTVEILDSKELSNGNIVIADVVPAQLTLSGAALRGAKALKTVELPSQLIRMSGENGSNLEGELEGVFFGCESLTSCVFRGRSDGKDVDLQIAACTFEGCKNLSTIDIHRHTRIKLVMLGGYMVGDVFLRSVTTSMTKFTLKCYQSDEQYYQSSEGWSKLTRRVKYTD